MHYSQNQTFMKQLRILSATVVAFLICALFITACQKSSSSSTATSTTSAADVVTLSASATADDQANTVYNGVVDNVMGVNGDAGLGAGIGVFSVTNPREGRQHIGGGAITNGVDSVSAPCYTVTISPLTPGVFPKTVTIDFGTGCTGKDGHTRRGKIISVYTGRLKNTGTTVTTTFDGFYVDSIEVEGTHTIQNKSTSSNLVFSMSLENGKLSTPSGDYIAVNRTHTWTQTAGDTTTPASDVFQITGSSNCTIQVSGITWQWSTLITTPLVREFSCRWIVSGQATITHGTKTAVLDYGAGTCDNAATLTVGGKVYNITLR